MEEGEGEEEVGEVEVAEGEEQGEVRSQEMELVLIHFSPESPAALSLQKAGRCYYSCLFGKYFKQL